MKGKIKDVTWYIDEVFVKKMRKKAKEFYSN